MKYPQERDTQTDKDRHGSKMWPEQNRATEHKCLPDNVGEVLCPEQESNLHIVANTRF
jgi:hypothetical protein